MAVRWGKVQDAALKQVFVDGIGDPKIQNNEYVAAVFQGLAEDNPLNESHALPTRNAEGNVFWEMMTFVNLF